MIISAIAAIGKNRVIGKDNQLMWHLPLEFKHFKDTTVGHYLITGRKNFESINKPLPNRTTIIVTRQKDYTHDDCHVVHSFVEALMLAKANDQEEVFVMGGGQIYSESLPYLHRFYRTIVDYSEEGDVYFPDYEHFDWKVIDSKSMDVGESNPLAWTFELLEKSPEKHV